MKNVDKTLNLDLIRKAQEGDRPSRATLAELIGPKVYAYVYRMTLDVHVAEDLSQETMVGLIRNLQQLKLKDPTCLWAWVYKTALNQVRDYFNRQRIIQNGNTQMRQTLHSRTRKDRAMPGPDNMMQQELLAAVTQAINTLKIQYRNILTLRCFQELSYSEIAQVIGNTELGARLLFYRAKRSLVRQLARDGFSKSRLITALSLFAAATISPIEKASAAAVSATAVHTGFGVKLLAVVGTTKLGIIIAVIAAMSLIPLTTFVIDDKQTVNLFHTVTQTGTAPTGLAYPAAIRASYDPDQSGWYGALESQSHTALSHAPGAIRLEQWLENPAGSDRFWLHIPQDHWIEITFGAPIADGDGDDILITERCCHGERAEVYLADVNRGLFLLATLQVSYSGRHNIITYGYDLNGIELLFVPTAIRIKTTNNGYREYRQAVPGLELLNVQARTIK
jgi:RNA polymerase sigma-70 factor (ECF subfamily)